MPGTTKTIRTLAIASFVAYVIALPANATSWGEFDNDAHRGTYVLSLEGAFVSPPPPFTGDALQFKAAQIGRLAFDGAGLVSGEGMLSFHNPAVPFGVTSRFAFDGTYDVAPNGKVVINLDEYPLDMNGQPTASPSNSFVLECYVVRRRLQSRCVMHTLISYQQGPMPRILPVTMSGTLQRQL